MAGIGSPKKPVNIFYGRRKNGEMCRKAVSCKKNLTGDGFLVGGTA